MAGEEEFGILTKLRFAQPTNHDSVHSVAKSFIIMIRHEIVLKRPVPASSHGLFKGLPSLLRPSGLKFSIISGILLLILLVT
jgi:hypothetical protein